VPGPTQSATTAQAHDLVRFPSCTRRCQTKKDDDEVLINYLPTDAYDVRTR
jgi:hypothetical protein